MRSLAPSALRAGLLGLSLVSAFALTSPAWADKSPAPASAQAIPQDEPKLFNAQTFTLDNGLQVVVVENHRVPVVSQMVWYKVGAADEPPGKSGIAHLFEHLMFKGTETMAPKEFSRTVARHGGRDNAFTSSDYTAYYENIAVENLELVMGLEADRMRNLVLDEENVTTERAVVYEERLTRTENEPSALLDERLENALWVSHPYRNPIIGWPDELLALDRQDALDFYAKWYAPNNAILVISGDVTLDQVRPLAEKTFGALERGPDITRDRATTLPPPALVRVDMQHAQVAQPTWKQIYIAPSYNTADDPQQVYALQVLSELLGGGMTSRFYRSLVIDQKVAAAAGTYYGPRAVDWSTFGLYVTPRPGVDIGTAEQAVHAEIARLLKDGITDQEVEDAKLRLRAGVIYARDGLQGAANAIGRTLATGGTLDELEYWPYHIGQVTTEHVMSAAQSLFGGKVASAIGVLRPENAPDVADAAPSAQAQ